MPEIPYYTSPLLSTQNTRHGFFGRQGGVSKGIYQSLNCGIGSGDDPDHVRENRLRCAQILGQRQINTARQVHSADTIFLTADFEDDAARPEADAIITTTPGLVIGALSADCMTVLFHDPTTQMIGAAHAGWRGALDGILENTVKLMQARGANPKTTRAAFGPCLRPPHFEVGDDLFQAFTDKHPESDCFFTAQVNAKQGNTTQDNVKYQLDLVGFGAWRLQQEGLVSDYIDIGKENTLADSDNWFSYRRAKQLKLPDYGRNLAAIALQS